VDGRDPHPFGAAQVARREESDAAAQRNTLARAFGPSAKFCLRRGGAPQAIFSTPSEDKHMKIGVAGQGAFGQKHLDALQAIPGIEVITLTGGNQKATEEVAKKYKIPHFTGDLGESLKQPGLEAMILATPTGLHASQGIQCMKAGKHVHIEIPIADTLADSKKLVDTQKETGVVCMGGHTRRFNPSHQYVHKKIKAGELKVQQMNVTTYFFRRTNMNAAGQPRSWTDHLLWHHACHTVDLFQYQTGELVSDCYAVQGPIHPELKIAMDMGIVMKVPSGAICTLSLSFNNKGPLGTRFRYICDNGTYQAYYDDLVDGDDKKIDLSHVDVSMNGIELQDREFFAAIKEKREPNASVQQCYTAMQVLDRLEQILNRSAVASAR
jgi:2-hydroxy-4-carboxymuconate semialdehyde hemiacetal dehydrogenase